ncbi:GspH/FimT family pseudopilin [Pseudoalteromonas sp. T1lg23B]|uniref:GspH/FimT family pseudopilin n=1 Tax=Pseudoalteromonas sp. T1lg23B TaxID=2077097 RepID=UPI000CF6E17C|nr:GspH/FimT family pseudopilin [Pseudoalteromonas sp. T1lg23B]
MHTKEAGLTLFEMLIAMTIMAVLLMLALSSYGEIISEHRPEYTLKRIKHALSLAKAHASASGLQATICHLEHNRCSDNQWHKSITVFIDVGEPTVFDADDKRLFELEPIHAADILVYPRRAIVFTRDGSIKGFTNGTFVYCLPEQQGLSSGLEMSISNSGRARLRDTQKCPL